VPEITTVWTLDRSGFLAGCAEIQAAMEKAAGSVSDAEKIEIDYQTAVRSSGTIAVESSEKIVTSYDDRKIAISSSIGMLREEIAATQECAAAADELAQEQEMLALRSRMAGLELESEAEYSAAQAAAADDATLALQAQGIAEQALEEDEQERIAALDEEAAAQEELEDTAESADETLNRFGGGLLIRFALLRADFALLKSDFQEIDELAKEALGDIPASKIGASGGEVIGIGDAEKQLDDLETQRRQHVEELLVLHAAHLPGQGYLESEIAGEDKDIAAARKTIADIHLQDARMKQQEAEGKKSEAAGKAAEKSSRDSQTAITRQEDQESRGSDKTDEMIRQMLRSEMPQLTKSIADALGSPVGQVVGSFLGLKSKHQEEEEKKDAAEKQRLLNYMYKEGDFDELFGFGFSTPIKAAKKHKAEQPEHLAFESPIEAWKRLQESGLKAGDKMEKAGDKMLEAAHIIAGSKGDSGGGKVLVAGLHGTYAQTGIYGP
jgi:hypothetical protein